LDGATLDRDALRGQVAIVNFWATWCPPCRVEIPALQDLHEEFGPEGLVVLGLSTDAGGVGAVTTFLAERGVTYPVAMADAMTRNAFGGVTALPTTFILDRDGVIRHRVFGFCAPPAMRAAVRRLLEESPASGPSEEVSTGTGGPDAVLGQLQGAAGERRNEVDSRTQEAGSRLTMRRRRYRRLEASAGGFSTRVRSTSTTKRNPASNTNPSIES
jgi:thiol-disulfide isomerase/thioredoxin